MRIRRVLGVVGAAVALVVLAIGVSGPAQAAKPCIQDVSGTWNGEVDTQNNTGDGDVVLQITQRHRRFHLVATPSNGQIVEGDGTIAASGHSHFNGQGATIKKINAGGIVNGECETTDALFTFDVVYVDGTSDTGTVTLEHVFDGGGT